MGVAHGEPFPGKPTRMLEPGNARGGPVRKANPPRRGWRADQWRVARGGARRRWRSWSWEPAPRTLRMPGTAPRALAAARGEEGASPRVSEGASGEDATEQRALGGVGKGRLPTVTLSIPLASGPQFPSS